MKGLWCLRFQHSFWLNVEAFENFLLTNILCLVKSFWLGFLIFQDLIMRFFVIVPINVKDRAIILMQVQLPALLLLDWFIQTVIRLIDIFGNNIDWWVAHIIILIVFVRLLAHPQVLVLLAFHEFKLTISNLVHLALRIDLFELAGLVLKLLPVGLIEHLMLWLRYTVVVWYVRRIDSVLNGLFWWLEGRLGVAQLAVSLLLRLRRLWLNWAQVLQWCLVFYI